MKDNVLKLEKEPSRTLKQEYFIREYEFDLKVRLNI